MYLIIKRIMDIILSLIGILLLSPLLIIISLWIKLDSPGPILFRQKRFGMNRKYFNIYKFRTMRVDTPKDKPTHLLENPYTWITKSGKLLRKTSLDELPQLFNILKGEMSIVGPRPALWNQFDLIDLRDKYNANTVPVGLTGWAQINGRDEISVEKKAQLDGEYARLISFKIDITCVALTFLSVIKMEGINEGIKFNGNKREN